MKPQKPGSFPELFDFYDQTVKPLYASVSADNEVPVEVLFELNAALDHLSRHWIYGEKKEDVVEKAYSHFKRCCLDIFKLKVKATRDQYEKLMKIDISLIDNGSYQRDMISAWSNIKSSATEARRSEGLPVTIDGKIQAFEQWQPVYTACVDFEKKFFEHSHVDWARRKQRLFSLKSLIISSSVSLVTGLIGGLILQLLFG